MKEKVKIIHNLLFLPCRQSPLWCSVAVYSMVPDLGREDNSDYSWHVIMWKCMQLPMAVVWQLGKELFQLLPVQPGQLPVHVVAASHPGDEQLLRVSSHPQAYTVQPVLLDDWPAQEEWVSFYLVQYLSRAARTFLLLLGWHFLKVKLGWGEKPFFSKVQSLSPYIVSTHKN